jgi:hypothetical protein
MADSKTLTKEGKKRLARLINLRDRIAALNAPIKRILDDEMPGYAAFGRHGDAQLAEIAQKCRDKDIDNSVQRFNEFLITSCNTINTSTTASDDHKKPIIEW